MKANRNEMDKEKKTVEYILNDFIGGGSNKQE